MPPRHITLGGLDKSALLERLEAQGVQINEIGRSLFQDRRFTTEPMPGTVEVVFVTVADLGLTHGGVYAQVAERARARGLCLCPLELAAHLRLQWLNQPSAPVEASAVRHRAPPGGVTVMTEAPPDDEDLPWGFYLRRLGDTLWLRGYRSWSGHLKAADECLVFMRPGEPGPQKPEIRR